MDAMQNCYLLVLAALLHDVGKFSQRAGGKASEGMDQEYCPKGSTHRHVLYTDHFIEHVLPLPEILEGQRGLLARMAAAHHRPDDASLEEMCLRQGDMLSSGCDRMAGESEGNFRTARLESIFSSVRLPSDTSTPCGEVLRYALRALDNDMEDTLFPQSAPNAAASSYEALYTQFLHALKDIPLHMGVRHYTHSLATVLERFTWCIPSSTYGTRADISLYDHAWTTASIAQALHACCIEHGVASPSTGTGLLLFGGDISGIQNYIFGDHETAHKGAAKLLRARSLVLQLFTRSLWLGLLERAGLCSVARIMDAGGRFVLLLPDTVTMRNHIQSAVDEAHAHVLKEYHGVIRLSFAQFPLVAHDLRMETFHRRFEEFNDILDQEKLRPFASAFAHGIPAVLPLDADAYAQYGQCPACRQRPAQGFTVGEVKEDTAEESLCHMCHGLITQVGRRLPQCRYIVFSRSGSGIPLAGGLRARLDETLRPEDAGALDILSIRDRQAYTAMPVAGHVPRVTQADMERWGHEGRLSVANGVTHFAGEPCAKGEVKTFAMLAEEARLPTKQGWRSVPCLAACKADVDNLGMLFGVGFGLGEQSRFSISRYAMLSRMLHNFFAAYLMRRIEAEFPNIYVIFAGGDDLFLLGPWTDVLTFAKILHTDFARFAGGNPQVTLSAGLPLVKPRLPVGSIKSVAEKALEAAKNYSASKTAPASRTSDDTRHTKNAVNLFDVTCPWGAFPRLLDRGQWLEELCLKGTISQGFVRRLLGYARDLDTFRRGDITKGMCFSHIAYDIARNCTTKDLCSADLQTIKGMIHEEEAYFMMQASASWALYRTRSTE